MNTKDLTGLKIAFRSHYNTYLCANRDTPLITVAKSIGGWEQWTIIPLDDEFTEFAIRSFNNKFLCARGAKEGATLDQSANLANWEHFKLIINLNNNLWAIQSVAHGSFIRTTIRQENPVDMQTSRGACENYNIEIVSQPIEVNNVKYNLDWSEIISEKLTTISSAALKNENDTPSKLEHHFKNQKQISFIFMQTYGPKIRSTKLYAKIPEVKFKVIDHNEDEWDWTSETNKLTYNVDLSFSAKTRTIVEPGKSVNVSLVATKCQIRVPWKAIAIYNVDNKEIKKYIGGIWEGIVYCNLHTRTAD